MDLKNYYKERQIKLIIAIVFFLLAAFLFATIVTDYVGMVEQRQAEWELRSEAIQQDIK